MNRVRVRGRVRVRVRVRIRFGVRVRVRGRGRGMVRGRVRDTGAAHHDLGVERRQHARQQHAEGHAPICKIYGRYVTGARCTCGHRVCEALAEAVTVGEAAGRHALDLALAGRA